MTCFGERTRWLDTDVFGPRAHSTASLSTQLAPPLRRLVAALGPDVIVRPCTATRDAIALPFSEVAMNLRFKLLSSARVPGAASNYSG
jgi:hypothetical protein